MQTVNQSKYNMSAFKKQAPGCSKFNFVKADNECYKLENCRRIFALLSRLEVILTNLIQMFSDVKRK